MSWMVKNLEAQELIPKISNEIYMTKNYTKLVNKIETLAKMKYPVLLVGHAGAGKNQAINVVANRNNQPVIRVNCSGDMRTSSLLGRITTDKDGKITWQDGLMVRAIRNGYWLVLDEINSPDVDILFALHGLLDEGIITISNNSEIVHAHPNFRLFATMNPQSYYGVKTLNQALLDRFAMEVVEFDSDIDKKIMEKLDQPEGVKIALTTLITNIRNPGEDSDSALSQNFGHRTLANVVRLSKEFDLQDAINMAYANKLPPSESGPFKSLANDLTNCLKTQKNLGRKSSAEKNRQESSATEDVENDRNAFVSNVVRGTPTQP
jgi:MoxR-like ATPase